MTTRPTPSRARAALVTGAATAAYYATPDFISSRTVRGWAKAGLTAVSAAASVPALRAAWATERERQALDGETLRTTFGSLSGAGRAAALASAAAALACSVGGVLAAERWVFRHGQARAVAGRRLPHTAPALLYGALAGGLLFVPTPGERH